MGNSICIMSTLLVGGTHRHYVEMAITYSFRVKTLLVEFDRDFFVFTIVKQGKIMCREIHFSDNLKIFLVKQFSKHGIGFIHLHHMIYMRDDLYNLLLSQTYKLAITLHDYYSICPRINMMRGGVYCQEASEEVCNNCIYKFSLDSYDISNLIEQKFPNIHMWRKYWFDLLDKANYIFVPSFDQRERLLRYFPSLTKIQMVENPELVMPPLKCNKPICKIGILGMISEAKGRSVLLKCARLAEKHDLNMQFILFGMLSPDECHLPPNLVVRGRYKENEVYSLIISENIDFFWFTAIWPETYSYVLTIPIRLCIPVIAADLGAIAERIKRGGWGEVYPAESEASEIIEALSTFDYTHYRNSGDFKIKNDHFLSFQEMYRDDINLFSVHNNYKGMSVVLDYPCMENHIGFKVCGSPSRLQPHELKFLWNKKAGWYWKIKLFFASDKISLIKKITQNLYKKSCSFLQL